MPQYGQDLQLESGAEMILDCYLGYKMQFGVQIFTRQGSPVDHSSPRGCKQ